MELIKELGYKLLIASNTREIYIKRYNDYINQIIKKHGSSYTANVEFSIFNIYINQAVIDELQIAFNRTKKDIRTLKEYEEKVS